MIPFTQEMKDEVAAFLAKMSPEERAAFDKEQREAIADLVADLAKEFNQ